MLLRNYLYLVLALSVTAFWYTDRTRQFYKGSIACEKSHQQAAEEYNKRQAEKYEKEIKKAVEEALTSAKHIESLSSDKVREVEKTRVIIKTIPAAGCVPDDSFLRDFNEALDSLQRKH